jgi:hypothetical protein
MITFCDTVCRVVESSCDAAGRAPSQRAQRVLCLCEEAVIDGEWRRTVGSAASSAHFVLLAAKTQRLEAVCIVVLLDGKTTRCLRRRLHCAACVIERLYPCTTGTMLLLGLAVPLSRLGCRRFRPCTARLCLRHDRTPRSLPCSCGCAALALLLQQQICFVCKPTRSSGCPDDVQLMPEGFAAQRPVSACRRGTAGANVTP